MELLTKILIYKDFTVSITEKTSASCGTVAAIGGAQNDGDGAP